jgi:hypothetical protein
MNIPTTAPIVLRFSQPMDTNSVQAAFSTSPAVGGAFRWSAANDTLMFTPAGGGLAGQTNIVVRVAASARAAVSGNPMFAPYELKFATAVVTARENARTNSGPPAAVPAAF